MAGAASNISPTWTLGVVGGDPDVQPTSTVNKQGRVRPYFYSGFFQQILWALPLIQMCQNDPMAQTKIRALKSVADVWKILPRNNMETTLISCWPYTFARTNQKPHDLEKFFWQK